MSEIVLPDRILLAHEDEQGLTRNRGVVLDRLALDRIAKSVLDGVVAGKWSAGFRIRVPYPRIADPYGLDWSNQLTGSTYLLDADRVAEDDDGELDLEWMMIGNTLMLGRWGGGASEDPVLAVWDVLAAGLAVGPPEAMRRHIQAVSAWSEAFDMMFTPLDSPEKFADAVGGVGRWVSLLRPEDLTPFLSSARRAVREPAIRALGTLRGRGR